MRLPYRDVVISVAFLLAMACCCPAQQEGKVYNGSFAKMAADGRAPDGWRTAGDKAIVQSLSVEKDAKRGQVARLSCTTFVPGTSSSHAMLAQMGHVGVAKGKWYRVSFWARSADLPAGVVQVSLMNSRTWANVGLSGSCVPMEDWQRFEFTFQANRDLPSADSRFAILFASTGTLWVADVAIAETTEPKRQWLPAIPFEGVHNALGNSSFELGGEGWGSWSSTYFNWTANVFQRQGQWDHSESFNGKCSWKLSLSADKPLMIYAGGAYPLATPVRSVELGHPGWVRVQPGQPYVFSAYLKAGQPRTQVRLALKEPEDWHLSISRIFQAGQKWQRFEVTYTPKNDSLGASVGLELPKGDQGEKTIWIDALQFERGTTATAYQPRTQLESQVETGVTGNILTEPAKGLCFRLRAYNAAKESKTLKGRLSVSDFWGRTVWEEKPEIAVGPQQSLEQPYAILPGRQGFFRIRWEPEGGLVQNVRCAVIEPYQEDDSVFGFNHVFCMDFLLPLSHEAGLRWWRDWSAQWETVQPKQGGPFDFSLPDGQINRTLDLKGRSLVLLPSPSAMWAAASDAQRMKVFDERLQKKQLNQEGYRRAVTAFKPKRLEDFAQYVRATVEHYHGRVANFEILNEPLYTSYSLPEYYGYKTSDYIDMLKTAYQAIKAVDSKCTVIGGMACSPSKDWAEKFIEGGGLDFCDVANYHWYPARQRAEGIEPAFTMRWEQMQKRGQAKPIWVTEFGLYAEDDPTSIPFHAGDETMNDAMRPDELTASADMVQLITMMCANGVRKVFYHAAVCQGLRDSSIGNIFFEYGGTPRKMYAAQAVMARMLGPDLQFVRKWDKPEGLHAYQFRSRGKTVVVAWTRKSNAPKLEVPQGLQAFDFMGNPLDVNNVVPSEVPLYLVGK